MPGRAIETHSCHWAIAIHSLMLRTPDRVLAAKAYRAPSGGILRHPEAATKRGCAIPLALNGGYGGACPQPASKPCGGLYLLAPPSQ